jgi:hypothetical protein
VHCAFDRPGLIIPFYLVLFASTYFLMERAPAASFTHSLTRTDALYFNATVFSTVGFGDIAAKSEIARVALIVQMLGDLALLGAGARVLLEAVRRGQQRRSGTDDGAPGGELPSRARETTHRKSTGPAWIMASPGREELDSYELKQSRALPGIRDCAGCLTPHTAHATDAGQRPGCGNRLVHRR